MSGQLLEYSANLYIQAKDDKWEHSWFARKIRGAAHDWLGAQGAKPKKANDSRMTHEITCYHMMCHQCQ